MQLETFQSRRVKSNCCLASTKGGIFRNSVKQHGEYKGADESANATEDYFLSEAKYEVRVQRCVTLSQRINIRTWKATDQSQSQK